ncbi:unnamed protein product [Mytilus coruscus]|uniref:Uncharacterized protein n=1 Tax=Mytilus coruscus TaxID=42192 RepID=A0A6J8CGG9_MYTCO|nr:unnamed protein product [Mytilus coruscus]
MSFNVSYNGLATKNIKHIYSTRQSVQVNPYRRNRIYNPPSLSYEYAMRKRPDVSKRLMAYDPEYGTILPRAPAFRALPGYNLERMVSRLTKPNKTKANPRECQHYKKSFNEYESDIESPRDEFKRTKSEVRRITDRLLEPNVCHKHHHYSKRDRYKEDGNLTPIHM